MSKELNPNENKDRHVEVKLKGGSDSVYGLGMIGAWAFFIGRAESPRQIVEGFFKGLVWPAFLVYELLGLLDRLNNPE